MISEPDAVDLLIMEMLDMDDLKRQIVFQRLKEKFCDDCGRVCQSAWCNCTNDE